MIAAILIEIPSWGNVTLIELAWLFSGVMAIVVSAVHIPALWLDWQVAIDARKPVLRAVGAGYLRREVIRFLQGACIVSVGVYAVIQPPVLPGPASTSILGLVVTAVLVLLGSLVAVQSVWDWRTRGEVQGYLGHEVPTENAILLVDAAGKITYANGVADKVFGRRLVGVQVEELVPERLRAAHRKHRADYAENPVERPMGLDLGTVGVRPDGSEFPIYATLSSFDDEKGETFTMVTAKLG